jgi:hypothetical protein
VYTDVEVTTAETVEVATVGQLEAATEIVVVWKAVVAGGQVDAAEVIVV